MRVWSEMIDQFKKDVIMSAVKALTKNQEELIARFPTADDIRKQAARRCIEMMDRDEYHTEYWSVYDLIKEIKKEFGLDKDGEK